MGGSAAAARVLKSVALPEVSSFLREMFPSFLVKTVAELAPPGGRGDGFLVNRDTVFRFPASEDAAVRLKIELCLLPKLASCLPLPIPNYCGSAFGPDALPLCACYPFISGEPLLPQRFAARAGDTPWCDALVRQLGEFLTALHSFPTREAESCGLAQSRYPLIEQVVRWNAAVRTELYPHLNPEHREFLSTAFKGLLWELRDYDPPTALCHGRLSGERRLIALEGDILAGVTGWSGMTLGDPAMDFTWRTSFGDDFFFQVLRHYHCPLPEPEQFARVVAYHCQLLPVQQLMLALKAQNTEAFQHARDTLTRI